MPITYIKTFIIYNIFMFKKYISESNFIYILNHKPHLLKNYKLFFKITLLCGC